MNVGRIFVIVTTLVVLCDGQKLHQMAVDQPITCVERPVEQRENQAAVILTGTVRALYQDEQHPQLMRAEVEIKRVMKGERVLATLPQPPWQRLRTDSPFLSRVVMVAGLGDPRICKNKARLHDSRIFLLNKAPNGELTLNSSLIPLSLNTIDRADAAVNSECPYCIVKLICAVMVNLYARLALHTVGLLVC